jgi:hypothetical protein
MKKGPLRSAKLSGPLVSDEPRPNAKPRSTLTLHPVRLTTQRSATIRSNVILLSLHVDKFALTHEMRGRSERPPTSSINAQAPSSVIACSRSGLKDGGRTAPPGQLIKHHGFGNGS